MGLVDHESHDAFLSYAHDDNVLNDYAVGIFREQFSRKFTAEMGRRLNRPGVDADVLMDCDSLPANGDLTEELTMAIRKSLFLIIFVGRWYPDSEWCGKELAIFTEQFDADRQAALERTFIVVLEKAATAKSWGEYLDKPERPIYQRFYDERTGRIIPFMLEGPDGTAVQSPRFSRRIRQMVETMADRASEHVGKPGAKA